MVHGNIQANVLYQTWKIQRAYIQTLFRITMQLPLFQLKHFHFFTDAITLISHLSFLSTYVMQSSLVEYDMNMTVIGLDKTAVVNT